MTESLLFLCRNGKNSVLTDSQMLHLNEFQIDNNVREKRNLPGKAEYYVFLGHYSPFSLLSTLNVNGKIGED